ncbi:glycoside hydrolase family 16 protein [Chromobacterium alkanivorans]|uniref:glycoside hydrolase family 16 protein n=1 Tax=Chromobacterium alkanivorans TaxID=1071719 RepID=UPI001966F77C|nr:glycoside hydrolase family 16 protein [Chromobacterium alkanivorans]MBN3006204.1 glycoside hydrolase family 16 protein [Chromobacterium alkanivorans]
MRRLLLPLLAAGLTLSAAVQAKTLNFSGYAWEVRNQSQSGPGPNDWDENNAWVDAQGRLHLKIAHRGGKWSSAEVYLPQRLGFGRYQFKLIGRPDLFDDNIVLGLFNYPTPDVGPDATNEIDIEFARWGNRQNPMGNYTVYPAMPGPKPTSYAFEPNLNGDYSTHRFNWDASRVLYQSLHGHQDGDLYEMARWNFAPADPTRLVPQQPLPPHINLWLFQGRPPKDGKEVEIVIKEFSFIPATAK